MPLPEHGMARDEVLAALAAKRGGDARWREGRTFGLVFDGGESVHGVAEAAAMAFLHENALNPAAFPSLGEIQAEVVEMCLDLCHAPPGGAGFMTSGGTESILMAVVAARERGRVERGITEPAMVVPASAHAAFHKAGHYFGVEVRSTPVGPDWRADVDAVAGAVDGRTVLVAGSAPQFPQGVVDPIPDMAAVAQAAGASFHVDACMGGFVLPFMERLGEPVPPWDFRVEGVTSVSADIHKLGYAPKGASVVLHRSKELRRHQTFVFDDWLGGFYASPGMQGTRPALPMAAAWAVMCHLGADGYERLTATALAAARAIAAGVAAVAGLEVLGAPDAHLLAVTAAGKPGDGPPIDVFAVGEALAARGWYVDRQTPPDALHLTVSAGNAPVVGAFLEDLRATVTDVAGRRAADRSTTYASPD